MHIRPPKRLVAALTVLCLTLLLNSVATYFNVTRVVNDQNRISHTLQVRQALAELFGAVVSLETALKGYAISGQAPYLSQHKAAAETINAVAPPLRRLIADNSLQQRSFDALIAQIRQKAVFAQHVVDTRQKSGQNAALDVIAERGPALLESIRAIVDEMDDREDALLITRNEIAATSLRATIAGLVVFTVASILLALLVVYMLRREVLIRDRAQKQLFGANEMLRTVLNSIPQRVFWKDRESRYMGANRLFAEDVGFQRAEQIVGKTDEDIGPSARTADRADDQIVMETGAPKLQYQETLQRQDGTTTWCETSKVPLRDMSGTVIGLLGTYQDISARLQYEGELQRQANFDALTGLPNRLLLVDRVNREIAQARRIDGAFALAVVDLDNFKLANDAHGHAFGDQVLVEVARRLEKAVRSDDTVSRYGGDEFVLVVGYGGSESFVTVVDRVLAAIAEPIIAGDRKVFVTCSVGVSTYPQDGADCASLLSHADAAMYRAKQAGRNCFAVFEPVMARRIQERVSIEGGLRSALENGQLFLQYQPQFSFRSGRVEGVEALARWRHPEQGLISPARFIPVAEDSGLIVPMGEWILRKACAQAKDWIDSSVGPLVVAVNLSAIQFRQKGFTELVARVLSETGLPSRYLELEITESLLMSEADEALAILTELTGMGICLSIDDFGTGYSSLSYLKRLPVAKLKIDQSFVRDIPQDPEDVAIAKAVIALSRGLELSVIAEGVETSEQYEFLRRAGCDEVQGYYLSRPVDAGALGKAIRDIATLTEARAAVEDS